MAKKSNNYFELIKKQTSYCVEASNLLEEILCKFHAESINAYRTQMHEIEHTADEIRHDILNKLSTEFIGSAKAIGKKHLSRIVEAQHKLLDHAAESAEEPNASAIWLCRSTTRFGVDSSRSSRSVSRSSQPVPNQRLKTELFFVPLSRPFRNA